MAGNVNKCYLLSWVMVITLSFINYGFGITYYNSFTEMIYKQFKSKNINVVEGENLFNSIVSSMIPAGALIGTLIGGYLAGRGRRYAIILLDICLMFAIVLTVTYNFYLLLLGRFIYGIYIGATWIWCALFVEEISPKEHSASMGTFIQIMITVGFIIAYSLGFLVPYEYTKEGDINEEIYTSEVWRWIFWTPILVVGLQLLLLIWFFRYDSPRYYHLTGDTENKQKAMKMVSDEDYLESEVDSSNTIKATFCQMFSKNFRCALSIGWILILFNQLTGANAIAFYSNKIFIRGREGYEAEHDARIGTLWLGFGTFGASSLTYFLTEYFPKKRLLLIGFIFMSITFGFLWVFAVSELDNLILVFTWVFLIFYNISAGTLIPPYNAQILPDKGVSITQFFNWFLVVLISSFTEQGFEYLKAYGMYLLFCGSNLFGFIFVFIFVKETKGVDKSRLLKLYLDDYHTTAQQEYQHLSINPTEDEKENDNI